MNSIGERIKLLRKEKNLKQGDLAMKLRMTSAQLCRIEGSKNAPSIKTLARIAKALGTSLTELMDESTQTDTKPIVCSSDDTRVYGTSAAQDTNEASPLLPIRETTENSEELQSIKKQISAKHSEYTQLESELGLTSATTLQLSYPYATDERGAEILSRMVRTSCDAGSTPFSDLISLLESRNIRIVLLRCNPEIQSRSFYNTDSHTLIIAINKRLLPERQLYRIAYELGYACIFGSTGFSTVHEDATIHKFVRRFAAAFLMPEDAVRGITTQLALGPSNWTLNILLQLKLKFGVSAETFAHRLEKLDLLSASLRKRFKEELRNYYEEHNNSEPTPSLKTLPIDSRLALLKLRTIP